MDETVSLPSKALPAPGSAPSGSAPLSAEQLANIEALVDYVAEQGLDKDGTLLAPALDALDRYNRQLAGGDGLLEPAKDLLKLYVQLGALTAANGVTGRSIRSSASSLRHLAWMRFCGITFLAVAIGAELLGGMATLPYQQVIAGYAIPFFWGGIGAIVFLMKTITDRASDLTFDSRKLQGLPERILLGALCGTITVNLMSADSQGLTKAAVGFLAGLGTKAVYAVFETMVNAVSERIGGKQQPNS